MKKGICMILAVLLCILPVCALGTLSDGDIAISAPSAALMEKTTGALLYEKNAHERRAPASVTKVMTLLLIMEAVERGDISLDDTVTASKRAASFGGSCVYLEEGEKMSVDEMIKCIAVVSANDCAVAMSEYLCGTEQSFVQRMNERAAELELCDTHFTNCTGLFDDDDHYTSAYDLAVMSRELIRHELIKNYTTIWMDSIRGGDFGLTNTNKLVYWYEGCTGLKTGFTSLAGYCLAATAERDGVEYIAVVMGGESIDSRNEDAKTLLSFAFANYSLCPLRSPEPLPPVRVRLGSADGVQPVCGGEEYALVLRQDMGEPQYEIKLPEELCAPVEAGQSLGSLTVTLGSGEKISVPLVAADSVPKADFGEIWAMLWRSLVHS